MPPPPRPVDLSAYLERPSPVEQELLRIWSSETSLVILDVGSCEGEDSIRYARRFPRARVFAFEPLPANQALIRHNLARYGADRVELVPLALSDRRGQAEFHVSAGQPAERFSGDDWNYGNKSSSLLPPAAEAPMHGWVEFRDRITVETDTLANFCAARQLDRIDFMHLDVQGAERLVLAGAGAMLDHTAAVWLEVTDEELYRGQALRDEIERLLDQYGFSLGFEERREIEGDQFYVNRRFLRSWHYLASNRLRRTYLKTRRLGGALKRLFQP